MICNVWEYPSRTPGDERIYKYFWWGIPKPDTDDDFVAIGRFGRYIFVSPANDVVIVRNGPRRGEFDDPTRDESGARTACGEELESGSD